MADIEQSKIKIRIEAETKQAEADVKRLDEAINQVGRKRKAAPKASPESLLGYSVKNITDEFKGLASKVGAPLRAVTEKLRNAFGNKPVDVKANTSNVREEFKKATDDVNKFKQSVQAANNQASTTNADGNQMASGFSRAASAASAVSAVIGGIGTAISAIRKAIGVIRRIGHTIISGVKKVWSFIKKIGEGIGKLLAPIKKIGGALLGGLVHPFSSITNAVSKFGSALKRILFLRIVRSIVRELTQGVKEGINNLYEWSKTANGVFSQSMNRLASSALYLKNSIGAALAPTINALTPIIERVVDRIVALLNIFNELAAKFTGAKTYTVATRKMVQYGDATDSATESTKKLERELLGFDKITKLTDHDKGSGSSGSNSGVDTSGMFETKTVNEATNLKQAFIDIANAINEKLGGIDWEDIKTKAYNGAKAFGEAVTAGIDTVDWGLVGRTVTGAFTTATAAIQGFFDGMDGETVAEAINEFFSLKEVKDPKTGKIIKKGFDGEAIGKGVAAAINSAVTFINDTLKNVKFTDIGIALANVANGIKEIDWAEIGDTISTGIGGIADIVTGFSIKFDWAGLADSIKDLIKGLDNPQTKKKVTDAVKSFTSGLKTLFENNPIEGAGKMVGGYITAVFDGIDVDTLASIGNSLKTEIVAFLEEVPWGDIGTKIGELLAALPWGEILSAVWEAIKGAINGFVDGFFPKSYDLDGNEIDWGIGFDGGSDSGTSSSVTPTTSKIALEVTGTDVNGSVKAIANDIKEAGKNRNPQVNATDKDNKAKNISGYIKGIPASKTSTFDLQGGKDNATVTSTISKFNGVPATKTAKLEALITGAGEQGVANMATNWAKIKTDKATKTTDITGKNGKVVHTYSNWWVSIKSGTAKKKTQMSGVSLGSIENYQSAWKGVYTKDATLSLYRKGLTNDQLTTASNKWNGFKNQERTITFKVHAKAEGSAAGGTFPVNIENVKLGLAKGGIITHQARKVAIGEAGREAVLPLDTNTEWMDTLAEKIVTSSANINKQATNVTIPVYVGDEKLATKVVKDINKQTAATGVCPIRVGV